MTTIIENRDVLVCELNDDEIARVSGGTSDMMHAVAAAAYKFMNQGSTVGGFGYDLGLILDGQKPLQK